MYYLSTAPGHDSYKIVPSPSMHYNVQYRSITYFKVSRNNSVKRKSQLLRWAYSIEYSMCANMWVSSVRQAQQGAVFCHITWDCQTCAYLSHCFQGFLSIALQSKSGGLFRKERVESLMCCIHLDLVSHYRLQILFFFDIENLVGRAGNLKEEGTKKRSSVRGFRHLPRPTEILI